MRRAGASSNDATILEIAEDLLRKGQSATAAALGAFFMVAAEHEGTLFGPMVLLVAGTGRGVKVFDGRLRQPGLGRKRPRGFLASEAIPRASRVAVPLSIAAGAVAMAFDGRSGLGQVIRPAIGRARDAGFPLRAEVLENIASLGPKALSESLISQAFLRSAGPSVGGIITPADLRQIPETAFGAAELPCEAGLWSHPFSEAAGFPVVPALRQKASEILGPSLVLLTADPEGVLAGICFYRPASTVAIEGLELAVPASAVPVERGVARVPAGAALYAPTPMAVLTSAQGAYVGCAGFPDAGVTSLEALERARLKLRRDPTTLAVY